MGVIVGLNSFAQGIMQGHPMVATVIIQLFYSGVTYRCSGVARTIILIVLAM